MRRCHFLIGRLYKYMYVRVCAFCVQPFVNDNELSVAFVPPNCAPGSATGCAGLLCQLDFSSQSLAWVMFTRQAGFCLLHLRAEADELLSRSGYSRRLDPSRSYVPEEQFLFSATFEAKVA